MDIDKALVVRVQSLNDLARVAGSIVLTRNPMYIMRFAYKGRPVYTMLSVIRDYYKFNGVPLAYYYVGDPGRKEDSAKYMLVKVDETGEEVVLTNKIQHGYAVIPILDMAEPPPFFPLDALEGGSDVESTSST